MTIRVRVENADNREEAIVVVKTQTKEGKPISGVVDVDLGGRQSDDFLVHTAQRLVIEEVRNG